MKTYLLAFCGIIASISALGQGTITGTVTDKVNGDILLGATIMIEPGGTGVMSDFDGNYTLTGLAPGTYTLIGRFIAYNSKEQQLTIPGNASVSKNYE